MAPTPNFHFTVAQRRLRVGAARLERLSRHTHNHAPHSGVALSRQCGHRTRRHHAQSPIRTTLVFTAPCADPWSRGLLGYGGLLPFVALAAGGLWAPSTPWWSAALLAYGAVILSFVGALHWGFAMALSGLSTAERTRCFVWSVVPSLMAWPATLLPPAGGAALLVTGFVAHLVQDHRLAARTSLPAWYLPLRWRLTTTACVCLAVGAMAASR